METKEIKYSYFDMDGTVLKTDKTISQENLEAIKYLKQKNIFVGVATGRHFIMMKRELELLDPNLPQVYINGSLIIWKNKIIKDTYIPKKLAKGIYQYLFENNLNFYIYTNEKIFTNNLNAKYCKWLESIRDSFPQKWQWTFFETKSFNDFKNLNIYKILIDFETDDEEKIIKKMKIPKTLNIDKSQKNLYDICNKKASKGNALKFLNSKKLIDLSKTIVFGDNENDVSMFEVAKVSVAMGNAPEKVSNSATHSTITNDEHGVSHFIKKHF